MPMTMAVKTLLHSPRRLDPSLVLSERLLLLLLLLTLALADTDPDDLEILTQFRRGLHNPGLLGWPAEGGDPCGPPSWKHVFCEGDRVTQIQVRGLGLAGPLPARFNRLSRLANIGLQQNNFTGPLPSFAGLSDLRYAYLDFNAFDSIPVGFFAGLSKLEVMALDYNPLNATTGWALPSELQGSLMLRNLSLISCNLVGPVPQFLGKMSSLSVLKLSMNRLSGEIPESFRDSVLQILWLNDQKGGGMTGPIDVVSSMVSLTSLWLHGNNFTGTIPDSISNLTSLMDLDLNGNSLVGLIPDSLANMELDRLDLNNNHFMGPVPKFKAVNASWESNSFCQTSPGMPCSPQVTVLLGFLRQLNYPSRLFSAWSGNDPCQGPWLGLNCNSGNVSIINLPKFGLSGTLSPAIADLDSLVQIRLAANNITGPIPMDWTRLKSLTLLDLSQNHLSPPLPKFASTVKIVTDGNPSLVGSNASPPPHNSPLPHAPLQPPSKHKSSPTASSSSNSTVSPTVQTKHKTSKNHLIVIVAGTTVIFGLVIFLSTYLYKKKKRTHQAPSIPVVYPRDQFDAENTYKIAVASNTNRSVSSLMGSGSSASGNCSSMGDSHVTEAGNLTISVQVLRKVTKGFSSENELGRGGFGVVYKGELDDGTKIAVKRMEAGIISNKALDEFQAEIAVLSKVRHRNLVSLLGYSIEGNERILVYEYMPLGALSMHLFSWRNLKLEPLSWMRRLNIALDVARGMEYLHGLAHQSFIHRDLKPSNILLGDDYRAKVSDFGLVKLAPDGEKSVVTRLAGTFGYLAPEYAVTGKITTKADVFSFGVVLMELLTGLMALDKDRPEETQYLAAWFWHIKSDNEKLIAALDPVLNVKEKALESISIIAELAGHCTVREPNQRPDMGHVVNVLAPLVEKWKPLYDDTEEYSGIDYSLPLNQMVKGWQEAEGKSSSYMDLEDSKGSIPARPTGFAESFTSADGR